MGIIDFFRNRLGSNALTEAMYAFSRSRADKQLGKLKEEEQSLLSQLFHETKITREGLTSRGRLVKSSSSFIYNYLNSISEQKSITKKKEILVYIEGAMKGFDPKNEKGLLGTVEKLKANYDKQIILVQKLLASDQELRQEAA